MTSCLTPLLIQNTVQPIRAMTVSAPQWTPAQQATLTAVDNTIQQSLVGVNSAMAGETSFNPSLSMVSPAIMFKSASLPLDARVSDKIKQRIWNNEYIDLSTLLAGSVTENKYHLSIFNSSDSPSICLKPTTGTKRISSIDEWLQAFSQYLHQ